MGCFSSRLSCSLKSLRIFYILSSLTQGHLSSASRWFLKYHISISPCIFISTSLAQVHLKALHYLSLSLLLSLCCISVKVYHIQKKCNMACLCLSSVDSMAQGQNAELSLSLSLSLRGRNPLYFMYIYHPKDVNLLLIWFPTINSAPNCLSHSSHPLCSYFYRKGVIFPKFGITTISCSLETVHS